VKEVFIVAGDADSGVPAMAGHIDCPVNNLRAGGLFRLPVCLCVKCIKRLIIKLLDL